MHERVNHILNKGVKLYQSLNCENYLPVYELPREIIFFGRIVHLDIREVNLYNGVVFLGEPFLVNIFIFSNNSTRCLLFLCSYEFSGCGISYFLFDCHCKNNVC